MNLLSPLSLLWLLPVGGAIVVLYLLRLKRRDVIVPSTMLWQTVLQDTQANAPFQKLRRNLLLLLQLLAAFLLVFILARPFLWASGLGGRSTALVLDASASMQATDIRGGRFADAVAKATQMIRSKAPGDAVALVLAGDRPTLLSPLTTDHERLLTALRRATPTDAPSDMREALGFASSLVASRGGAQITVITDGAFGRIEPVALGGPRLSFVSVGRRADNAAITAFDVRDDPGGGTARQAFVTVQNFSTRPRAVPLTLRVNDKLIAAREVPLKPGETKSETFDNVRANAGGVSEARLDVRDDLPTDDRAYVTLAPRRPLRVLLVATESPFLERAVNIGDRVTLDRVTPQAFRAADIANVDLTIFDDALPPPDLKPGRYLFWGRLPEGDAALLSPAVTNTNTPYANVPQILDWNRTHPLTRFVDLANVRIRRARIVAPAPGAQTLAETEAGPLVVANERGDARTVYVGFTVTDSDLVLRPAFPIFVSNALQWLSARPGDNGGILRPGEPAPLALSPTLGPLSVTRPDGKTEAVPATPGSESFYARTDRVGVYRAKAGNVEQVFAVSLLAPVESNTVPVSKPSVVVTDAETGGNGETPAGRVIARREIWSFIAVAALLLLCAEWWVFHRRV